MYINLLWQETRYKKSSKFMQILEMRSYFDQMQLLPPIIALFLF